MHGRLKVRTTEEQEERKRLEREKKLKLYQAGMQECLSRIKDKNYDKIGLKISEEILSQNGDIQTLWNLRKNTILLVETSLQNDDDLIKLYLNELSLTETCLKKNPKSYGSWYHRQWCLLKANQKCLGEKSAQLSWKNELNLCNVFLNLDERNFHCWRHRFFVVKHGCLNKLNELEFTYEKICVNFSNYSSWHYRSKLIEELYYDNQIDSDMFKKELNLIENAIFTDPNDQSAWIYQKWLLLEYQRGFIKELVLDSVKSRLMFKLKNEIDLNQNIEFIKLNNVVLNNLNFLKDNQEGYWTQSIENMPNLIGESLKIELKLKNQGLTTQFWLNLNKENNFYEFKSKFKNIDSNLLAEHLKNILELNKLENESSKWCLLKSVELMCLIDFVNSKSLILNYLDKLANEIDLCRKNFYIEFKNLLNL